MKQKKKKKEERNSRKAKEVINGLIKDRIIRDIKTLLKRQEEDYYKPKTVSNFWKNNYLKYESNGDKNRNLSLDEYSEKYNISSSKF